MRAVKCTVLFFTAGMIFGVGHDVARAVAAGTIDIPDSLHQFLTLFGQQPETSVESLVTALAPLLFGAAVGVIAAWIYTQVRSAAPRLFWLYLATLGASSVFVALMATAYTGGVHDVTATFGAPAAFQMGLSTVGSVGLAVVMWQAGVRLQPPFGALVFPLVASTAASVLVYSPMEGAMVLTLLAGSAPWVIAVVASVWHWHVWESAGRSERAPVKLSWFVTVLAVLLVALVRWMPTDVHFGP